MARPHARTITRPVMWRDWANGCHALLARGGYDAIPDPPSKEEVTA